MFKWTGRCCLYPSVLFGNELLAGNCLPYHQPNCPTTDKPSKVLELTWFLLAFRGGDCACTASLGVHDCPPSFTPSFTRGIWCRRRGSTVPSSGYANKQRTFNHFSVAPYALKVLWSEGTLVAWPQPGTSLLVPFSVGKIGRTALLFPLVTSYAASHAVVMLQTVVILALSRR